MGTVGAVASFALRLPAGALADRVDRRHAMIVCDALRMVVLALLAALHAVDWIFVLAIATIDEVGNVICSPASLAACPAIIEPGQLENAWAASEGISASEHRRPGEAEHEKRIRERSRRLCRCPRGTGNREQEEVGGAREAR